MAASVPGSLNSYKSKASIDYQLGSSSYTSQPKKAPAPPQPPSPDTEDAKPADDDTTWSDATTSDMLF